jgi:hypothetical protein
MIPGAVCTFGGGPVTPYGAEPAQNNVPDESVEFFTPQLNDSD